MRVEAPLRELREQLAGRRGALAAVGGQLARVDARRAARRRRDISRMKRAKSSSAAARRSRRARAGRAQQRRAAAAAPLVVDAARASIGRAGTCVVVEVAQDHVLVAVVVVAASCRPASTPSRGRRRRRGSPRRRRPRCTARIVSFVSLPVRGVMRLGVVVDRPEVERRAEAREVAGVGERVRAFAAAASAALHRNASVENVVWTWRSPNRICLAAAADLRCAALASAAVRSATTSAGMVCFANVPGPCRTPYQPSTTPAT